MKNHRDPFAIWTFLLCCGLNAPLAWAAPPSNPVYPRFNPSPWYQVDTAWPGHIPSLQTESRTAVPAVSTGGTPVLHSAVPGVALDAEGNVFLFTRGTPSVQVYSPEGNYLFGWGKRPGAHHIAIDRDGFVWTTDVSRHIVQKHERDGTVVMTLGVDGEAGTDEGHFFKPTDVDFASNGDIFVSDGYGNARVMHFDKNGAFLNTWGSLGNGPGRFSIAHALAIDSKDRLYVADRNNARIQVFDTNGTLLDTWQHILIPWGMCITEDDAIWICGSSTMTWDTVPEGTWQTVGVPPKDQLVVRFDTTGKVLELHTFPKGDDGNEQPGELNWVHCIAVDGVGNLYLGDIEGKRLQKFVRMSAN